MDLPEDLCVNQADLIFCSFYFRFSYSFGNLLMPHFVSQDPLLPDGIFIIETVEELQQSILQLSSGKELGTDTETIRRDREARVCLIQIAQPKQPVYIIQPQQFGASSLFLLNHLFGSDKLVKLFHNGLFDISMLERIGIQVVPPIHDSLIASRLIGMLKSHSLKAVAQALLAVELDKSIRESFEVETEGALSIEQIEYGAKDAVILSPIHQIQMQQIHKKGMGLTIHREVGTTLTLARSVERGASVDGEELEKRISESSVSIKEITQQLKRQHPGAFGFRQKNLLSGASAQVGLEDIRSPQNFRQAAQAIGLDCPNQASQLQLLGSNPELRLLLKLKYLQSRRSELLEAKRLLREERIDLTYNPFNLSGQIDCKSAKKGAFSPECIPYRYSQLSFPYLDLKLLAYYAGESNLKCQLVEYQSQSRERLLIELESGITSHDLSDDERSEVAYLLLKGRGVLGYGKTRLQQLLAESGYFIPLESVSNWIAQVDRLYPQLKGYHKSLADNNRLSQYSFLGRFKSNYQVSGDLRSDHLIYGTCYDLMKTLLNILSYHAHLSVNWVSWNQVGIEATNADGSRRKLDSSEWQYLLNEFLPTFNKLNAKGIAATYHIQ